MCRLYVEKDRKRKNLIKLQVEVTLSEKDMRALQKEVEQQREFQKKRGTPDWT